MPIVDAYAARKYQTVMNDTFGHLRAKPGEEFDGYFVFAHTLDGYTTLLAFEFGDDLACSPWLHEDTCDYMDKVVVRHDYPKGMVFRFDGKYKVSPRGWRRFVGKVKKIDGVVLAKLWETHRRKRK